MGMTGVKHEVALLHNGRYFQLETVRDLLDEGFLIRPVYLPDVLTGEDTLDGIERLFVSDHLHPRLWSQIADRCVDVARRGGIVFLSGINAVDAVPGFTAEVTETNYWWWKTGEDPGIYVHRTREPLQAELSDQAHRWHHHAVLQVPEGAAVLATHVPVEPGGPAGVLLAVDRSMTPGTIAITTMDPVYHHGSRFMPGASELLRGVIRWISYAQ